VRGRDAPRVLRIRLAGDAALSAEFEPRLDTDINRAAASLAALVRQSALRGVRDVVVTTHAVTAYVDPLHVDWAALEALLRQPVESRPDGDSDAEPLVVPVTYGGVDGPDLEDVARACGCLPDEIVARHSAPTYRVFMVGFMPGFGYLGPLDERLRLARRPTPRLRVPAGSVGIAGPHTAVYPGETPGGWWIIGRTTWRPFDAAREPVCLLEVGGKVRFEPRC
jgi:KipI family sensor histidine kinase inhibitor